MLRSFTTQEELLEACRLTESFLPELISIHVATKFFATSGRFKESPVEVYAYPWPDVKCWLMVKRNTLVEPFVEAQLVNNGTTEDIKKCFDSAADILENVDYFLLFNIEKSIVTQLCHLMNEKYYFAEHRDFCFTFYMPKDIQAEIAKLDIKLPDGYYFCDLDPELDAPLISETWIHRRDDDLPYTQGKLKYLPSVGVKFGDRLVSFEMVCPSGSMNHLFTLPEFRGKGLGTAVELRLCQKLIAMDIWPFKRVITENTKTVEMTLKLSYWKQLEDEKTKEATVGEFRRLKHRSSGASIESSYHNKN